MDSTSINFIQDLRIIHRLEQFKIFHDPDLHAYFFLQKKENIINQVIHAILNSGRPIVLHNGMLDLCHIYRRWFHSQTINSNHAGTTLCTTADSDHFRVIPESCLRFELTEYAFVAYFIARPHFQTNLQKFHWRTSIKFGKVQSALGNNSASWRMLLTRQVRSLMMRT